MHVTVILCTYNRCKSLAAALASVAESQLPPSIPWEVLVVDNNSSDRTREVVEEFTQKYPGRFRYMFESQQGKSHALNAGIREAKGDVMAFMDDDVTVEQSWLRKLTEELQTDRCAGAGGRVIPLWNSERPKWLPEDGNILAPLVLFNVGEQAGPLLEAPFGTNMAFRREMFQKYGGFRTDLGPRPDNQIRGEDSEFAKRLLGGGEQLYYEPGAVVYHPVTSERLTKKYFLQWWFDKGRSDVLEWSARSSNEFTIAGVPVGLFKRFAAWTIRWTFAFEARRRFDCKRSVWGLAGEIVQRYRLARAGKYEPAGRVERAS